MALADEEHSALCAELSRTVVRILKQHVGRGPTKCRAELTDHHAVVLCRETLTEAEKTLVVAGKLDQVKSVRIHLHDALGGELTKAAEAITGRPVVSLLSDLDPAADLSAHMFVFERRPGRPSLQIS